MSKVIKQLTNKLLKGDIKNVMTISKPIEMWSNYTLLEIVAK